MSLSVYASYWEAFLEFAPRLFWAAFTLILGWAIGRILGIIVSRFLKKIGVERLLRKTLLGKALERSEVTAEIFLDLLVRWIIYLSAILVSIDLLNIRVLSDFVDAALSYLPRLLSGVFTMVIGLIIVDYIVELIRNVTKRTNLKFVTILMLAIRLMLYFVVIVMSLSMMEIETEILYIFANAIALGSALGIGVGLGIALGWGLKDVFAKNAAAFIQETVKTLEQTSDNLEVTELKKNIGDLEMKIKEKEEEIRNLHRVRMEIIEDLSAPIDDAYAKLRELVEGKGTVSAISNGFRIEVVDAMIFPWFEVMVFLRVHGYDIWVTTEKKQLVIKSKLTKE